MSCACCLSKYLHSVCKSAYSCLLIKSVLVYVAKVHSNNYVFHLCEYYVLGRRVWIGVQGIHRHPIGL